MSLDFDAAKKQLIELLKLNKLTIFCGSGISLDPPSNLPDWDGLLEEFIKFCETLIPVIPENIDPNWKTIISDAKNQYKKYPARVASILKDKLASYNNVNSLNIMKSFSKWLNGRLSTKPNNNHKYIVSTNYSHILTSNYDNLLEDAAHDLNFIDLAMRSYSFNEAGKFASSIYDNKSSIVHIHGDMGNISLDDFVFTQDDYIRIRDKYKGFTLALQTLFIHNSILFVGYGASDPHLEDLIDQLTEDIKWSNSLNLPRFFLIIKKDKSCKLFEEYKKKHNTALIELENYSDVTKLLEELSIACPRQKGEKKC